MKWVVTCGLLMAPLFAAGSPEFPANVSDDDLVAFLGNMQVERRLDADLNGDGQVDLVYVAHNAHERVLGVIRGGEHTAQIGRRVMGEAALDPEPQMQVALGFENGVLSVDDLTGTETVTRARYQYRFDWVQQRLRLVALSGEQYSPTLSHGSTRLKWDLDTGQHLLEHGQVVTLDTGEEVYIYDSGDRSVRKVAAVYMENAPTPAGLLGGGRTAQVRVATDGGN